MVVVVVVVVVVIILVAAIVSGGSSRYIGSGSIRSQQVSIETVAVTARE